MVFKDRLRDLRKERGLSQQAVATAIGLSQRAYSFYEPGYREPTFDTLILICKFFDVSADYLLGLSDLY